MAGVISTGHPSLLHNKRMKARKTENGLVDCPRSTKARGVSAVQAIILVIDLHDVVNQLDASGRPCLALRTDWIRILLLLVSPLITIHVSLSSDILALRFIVCCKVFLEIILG